jgi:TatD DNase family protein
VAWRSSAGRPCSHDAVTDGQAADVGWTDSHCHLQGRYGPEGPDGARDHAALLAALGRAAQAGVSRVVCVGTDVDSSREAIRLANLDDLPVEVYATVGLHPHEAARGTDGLAELLDQPGASRVVAIGECGIDLFYEHSPRDAQLRALREQLALAASKELAVVLHVRDAFGELFELLDDTGVPPRTVVHCFSGDRADARRCIEAGMVVSISGIVTFKNASSIRDALVEVPLERLMVETDSPFLAPVPHRGHPNEPAFVALVGGAVAETLNLESSLVRAATSATASRVFGGLAPR